MNRHRRQKEVLNYLLFGILTTVVNIGSFYLLDNLLGMQYLWSNALSIVLSIIFAYITNKMIVFNSETTTVQEFIREFISFLSFRLISGVIDMISMWILVDIIMIDTFFGKLFTQFIVAVLNYLFSKFFVFKTNSKQV